MRTTPSPPCYFGSSLTYGSAETRAGTLDDLRLSSDRANKFVVNDDGMIQLIARQVERFP
jgi:hypothetical protein